MKRLMLIILVFNYSLSFSFNSDKFNRYIKSAIETIYSNKKVYIYSINYSIKKRQEKKFHKVLSNNYGIDSLEWEYYWTGYKNNILDNNFWYKKGISKNKKDRVIGKFNENEDKVVRKKRYINSVVVSYSNPIFLNKNKSDYILEITSHCYGLCSNSWIYFLHFNKNRNIIEIKHKITSSFS